MSVVTCICDDDDKLADSWVISSAASVSTTCGSDSRRPGVAVRLVSVSAESVLLLFELSLLAISAIYIIMIKKILIHEF